FRTDLGTDGARVALANSITLTPGTLTVSLEGDELLVHALDREMAHGLVESDAVRLLHLMEGGRDDVRSL
ncbi:MAG: Na+/H+ antiporter subunit E, partial [Fretibacterium sp.]|nr:Na+/H+ antiporter subunit E [Fretibacterium sp.]